MEEQLEEQSKPLSPEKFKLVQFRIENGVARIGLNRPPYNVMNIPMLEEIGGALDAVDMARVVKLVVFQGNDKAFSGGVDIADHTDEKAYQMLEAFHRVFLKLAQLEAVSMAVVKGMALGGACELAACCDFAFAAEDAKFGQPEIKVGVFPPIAAVVYPRLIGRHRALELILSGEVFTGREAEKLGLISKALPADQVDGEAERWIERISAFSAPVVQLARKAMAEAMDRPSFEEALRHVEGIYLNQLMSTEDAREGLQAFMQKRKPVWKNR